MTLETYNKKGDYLHVPYAKGVHGEEEIAAVITYTRIQFGDKKVLSRIVDPADVARVREEVKDKAGFYMVDEILEMHPHN